MKNDHLANLPMNKCAHTKWVKKNAHEKRDYVIGRTWLDDGSWQSKQMHSIKLAKSRKDNIL